MSRHRNATAPQIIDQASEWFVIMREPSASVEHREAFAEWLRASPVHVGAYLEIARLWTDASHIDPALTVDENTDPPPNVIPLREGEGVRRAGERGEALERPRATKTRFALAASLLIALAAGSSWLYINRAPAYVTDIGEQRTITLEDGSIIKLNSRSKLKVHMSLKQRQVELIGGQALFEVAHDAARPFVVTSGDVAIRAVGTQFDVNQRRSGTIVTVVEGRVKVGTVAHSGLSRIATQSGSDQEEVQSTEQVVLSAGEQVKVAQNGAFERTPQTNTGAAISWLQQELRFDGQPLSDVLEEFNRYTRIPLVLGDPSLGDLRINAVFHTTNPDSLLRFVERFDGVRVEKSAKEIRISRRN